LFLARPEEYFGARSGPERPAGPAYLAGDCEDFDYILTMDEQNYRAVASLCRENAVVMPFLDFAPDSPEREFPDPYGGGPEGFDHVLDLVEGSPKGYRETSASSTRTVGPEGGLRLKKGAHGCACPS
jgi:hypothetical protein